MGRKISLIVFSALLLGAFLVIRPYLFNQEEPPSITDRLPESDFMGRAFVLDLARECSGLLYYNKVTYREFLSEEFVLSQAKNFGIDARQAVYLFADENGTGGLIASVTDTAKVREGLIKLNHFYPVRDTIIAKTTVYQLPEYNTSIFYDAGYLCVLYGEKITHLVNRVASAKKDAISSRWRSFLNQVKGNTKSLSVFVNWKPLRDADIESSIIHPVIDSNLVVLHANFMSHDTLPFQLKQQGQSFDSKIYTNALLNLHLDISRFKANQGHPLHAIVNRLGRKIKFPTADFIKIWDGDLSFRKGGLITIQEEYIESILDEDFNVSEVTKQRDVKVPGFALMYTMNAKGGSFLRLLMARGFITNQEDKYYFLLSPPLNIKTKDNKQLFYATKYPPKMVDDVSNYGIINHRGTEYSFSIDSMNYFNCYMSLSFPVEKLLAGNRSFN